MTSSLVLQVGFRTRRRIAAPARRRGTRVSSLALSLAIHGALAAAVLSLRVGVGIPAATAERPEDSKFEAVVVPPAERFDDVVVRPPARTVATDVPPSRGDAAAAATDLDLADEEPPPPAAPSIAVSGGASAPPVPREWSPRPSVVRGGWTGRGHGSKRGGGGAGAGGASVGGTAAPAPEPEVAPAPVVEEPPPVVRVDARVVRYSEPAYPEGARRRREQGVVRVEVEVLADGTPGEVRVVESSRSESLDAAVVAAVRTWKFAAATVDGESVASTLSLPPFRFRLE